MNMLNVDDVKWLEDKSAEVKAATDKIEKASAVSESPKNEKSGTLSKHEGNLSAKP